MVRQMVVIGLLVAGLAALSAHQAGGTRDEVEMIVLPMPNKNPTSYDFDLPMKELRARVHAAFLADYQIKKPVFSSDSYFLVPPSNGGDICLKATGEIWLSPVYQSKTGGLPFRATFCLRFAEIGASATRVSITTPRAEVVNGTKLGMTHGGPWWVAHWVAVPPTSIEEYTILRYIGVFVGGREMPPVILPSR